MPCTYRLSSVIMELAMRAGMDPEQVDVGLLDQNVRGFMVVNSYPLSGALQALSQAYFFDPSNHGGAVHFVPRGGNSVATIDADELVDDDFELTEQRRADAIQIPRVLHLIYHDVAGGLATDKQTNDRAGDRRAVGEQMLQTAVILNADEAAQIVAKNHKVMIEDQRGELRFALPDNYIGLTVADVVILRQAARTERLRIVESNLYEGYQQLRALRDRQSAYHSNVEGIPAAPQTPPPSGEVGPTLLEVLDIAMLRDADDALGYYVAVSGILPAWLGATIEVSLDGGANYIDSAEWSSAAIMGETLDVLEDHPQAFPDGRSSVSVHIDTPYAELFETDLDGLLRHENLAIIGDEIVQFAEADEISEGIWQLSYFLRGRRGTTPTEHPAGTRFVMLERGALPLVPANLTELGKTLTFRATSNGMTEDTGTIESMVYTGQTQREFAPAYLRAHISGGSVVVSWQGVGRLGAGVNVAHGTAFAGYRVTILEGGSETEIETTAQTITEAIAGTGDPITIWVEQLNTITGAGPAAELTIPAAEIP